jgi:hypothetical protein
VEKQLKRFYSSKPTFMSIRSSVFIFFLLAACDANDFKTTFKYNGPARPPDPYSTIAGIPPPDRFTRIAGRQDSFAEWLRSIPLKKDNHVYLYNGNLKENQSAQFAVLDISVGKKDLQQCADAVMRLRAEYLFSQKRYTGIEFRDNNNKVYKWKGGADRHEFDAYLENVFGWCGTASLEKQLRTVPINDIQPGDVLIKGGFPGHAMMVADIAVNKEGKKIFMLVQSYMPAQDIHLVKNPLNVQKSPWYEAVDAGRILTPEWTFEMNQLRRW